MKFKRNSSDFDWNQQRTESEGCVRFCDPPLNSTHCDVGGDGEKGVDDGEPDSYALSTEAHLEILRHRVALWGAQGI